MCFACVFQVILSLLIVWGTCTILTFTKVLPEGDPARADAKIRILQGSPWFRIPYPCKIQQAKKFELTMNMRFDFVVH